MKQIYLFFNPSPYASKFFNTYYSYLKTVDSICFYISNSYSLFSIISKTKCDKNILLSLFIFINHVFYLLFLSAKWFLTGNLRSSSPNNEYEIEFYTLLDDEYMTILSNLTLENKRPRIHIILYGTLIAFLRSILLLSLSRVLASYPYKFVCCSNERVGIKNAIISTLSYFSSIPIDIVEYSLGSCQLNRPRSVPCVNQSKIQNYQPSRYLLKSNYILNKYPKNVVFLHVFADSSCYVFSHDRLHRNYCQWLDSITDYIKASRQLWTIRLHPHHSDWGENSLNVLKYLFPQLFELQNVLIDHGSDPIDIHPGDRVITFTGTVAEELALQGIRVITYDLTRIEQYSPSSTILLKSLSLESYFMSDELDRNLLVLDTTFTSKLQPTSTLLQYPAPSSLITKLNISWAYYPDDSDFSIDQLLSYYPFLVGI